MSVIDSLAPLKQVRLKQRSDPWMTNDILSQIKHRDNLLLKFKSDRTQKHLYSEYCKVRNKIQRDIRHAKSNYFTNCIDENKNNSKKLWQTLKDLGYSSKVKGAANIVLSIKGTYVTTLLRLHRLSMSTLLM